MIDAAPKHAQKNQQKQCWEKTAATMRTHAIPVV